MSVALLSNAFTLQTAYLYPYLALAHLLLSYSQLVIIYEIMDLLYVIRRCYGMFIYNDSFILVMRLVKVWSISISD